MDAQPITRAGAAGWVHDDGTPGVRFETFDDLDLDDPFGPRTVHLLLPTAPASDVPLFVFHDGDTTLWPGGAVGASWWVGRTVARLQGDGRLGPIALSPSPSWRRLGAGR